MALLLGAIGFSSCSRVYTSRNYVKSKQVAKEQPSEEVVTAQKQKAVQIQSIEQKAQQTQANSGLTYSPIKGVEKTESVEQNSPIQNRYTSNVNENLPQNNPEVKAKTNQESAPKPEQKSGEKSQLVALLLCFFVGVLGIHRFYLGYTVIGIIQLLTFGGFGIWALIDLILIITGDLQPKNGNYDKTFDDFIVTS